jgi:hypothetical protein
MMDARFTVMVYTLLSTETEKSERVCRMTMAADAFYYSKLAQCVLLISMFLT